MLNDPGTEAEALDVYDDDAFNDGETEFDRMLSYHDMSISEYSNESGNSQRQRWWNYRKLGKGTKKRK